MKHITYLALILFGFILSGCGDINEFTPTVANPNTEWKIAYTTSQTEYLTTRDGWSKRFTSSIDDNMRTIKIKHTVHNDARAILKPVVNVSNISTGILIDLLYVESSPGIITGAYVAGATDFTHNFQYLQKGGGATGNILVRTRFEYPRSGFVVEEYYQAERNLTF